MRKYRKCCYIYIHVYPNTIYYIPPASIVRFSVIYIKLISMFKSTIVYFYKLKTHFTQVEQTDLVPIKNVVVIPTFISLCQIRIPNPQKIKSKCRLFQCILRSCGLQHNSTQNSGAILASRNSILLTYKTIPFPFFTLVKGSFCISFPCKCLHTSWRFLHTLVGEEK